MTSLARIDLDEDQWLLLFWAVEKTLGVVEDEEKAAELEELRQKLFELDWRENP